jgi:hypothetical protein
VEEKIFIIELAKALKDKKDVVFIFIGPDGTSIRCDKVKLKDLLSGKKEKLFKDHYRRKTEIRKANLLTQIQLFQF